ncbi:MAG: hypothetical protein U0353_07265 [Sandaracinus sp.]
MTARLAFVLNLDAEHELEAGARWTIPRALAARLDTIAHGVRLPEGAVLVHPGAQIPVGYEARLWCPTPRAIAAARQKGIALEPTAPIEVIRRVNERGFAAELSRGELEPTTIATSLEAVEAFVALASPTGRWRLKKGLGASGRGQRTLVSGALSLEDRGWIVRALRYAPLYVEPEIAIEKELCVYGWARRDRGVELTGLRGQTTDGKGQFVRAGRIDAGDCLGFATPLQAAAERVGHALLEAGYHGPFGIDAYVHRTNGGARVLRAISEINARYCMGWDERDGF